MGFFRQRAKGYKTAVRVEKYRAAAVQLRENEPELYAQALAQANGSEAEAAAKRDPDAYVALVMAAVEGEKLPNHPTAAFVDATAPMASDFDYWPELDADAVLDRVGAFFGSIQEEKGAPQYYPNWIIRRHIAFEVIQHAASINPEVFSDGEALFAKADDPKDFFFQENPELDEELERYLARQHLGQIVDAVMGALTDENAQA